MSAHKILPPLDELVGYLASLPLIIEPFPTILCRAILAEIRQMHGKIHRIFYRNNVNADIPFAHLPTLAKSTMIKKIKFNGNVSLLPGCSVQKHAIMDGYLEAMLSLVESTPIIMHTVHSLDAQDKEHVQHLCENVRAYATMHNAYAARIPLKNIEALTVMPGVFGIQYHPISLKRGTTRTFLPSTFW